MNVMHVLDVIGEVGYWVVIITVFLALLAVLKSMRG